MQPNFQLPFILVLFAFLPGGSFEAAGRPHVLIVPVVPRLQANSPCVRRTSLVWGAGPHGSPRVSTGVSSRGFSLLKTAVFSRFLACSRAEKVLRWLFVQTSLLESNIQLPEIGIHIPTTGRWKLESRNPTSKFTLPELGLQLPISKSWMLHSEFQRLVIGFQLPTSGARIPTSNSFNPTSSFRQL